MENCIKERKLKNSSSLFFPKLTNVVWKDIIIKFIDGYNICITCKDLFKIVSYSQMNMSQYNGNPTKAWCFLLLFAANKGIIKVRTNFLQRHTRKQKSLLSQKLREYFQIQNEPIYWDSELRCYRTLFEIYYER